MCVCVCVCVCASLFLIYIYIYTIKYNRHSFHNFVSILSNCRIVVLTSDWNCLKIFHIYLFPMYLRISLWQSSVCVYIAKVKFSVLFIVVYF